MFLEMVRPNLSLAETFHKLYPGESNSCSLKLPSGSTKIARPLRLIYETFCATPATVTRGLVKVESVLGVRDLISGPMIRLRD